MYKLVMFPFLLALAAAEPSAIAPWGHVGIVAPLPSPLVSHVTAPVVIAAPFHGAHNYRGPLSLAPGQPASILAQDGRPLDTLSVNLDRAAHYTAKAIDHLGAVHHLRRRSAPLLAPATAWSHVVRVDGNAAHLAAPLVFPAAAHLGIAGHIAPLGLAHTAHWGRH